MKTRKRLSLFGASFIALAACTDAADNADATQSINPDPVAVEILDRLSSARPELSFTDVQPSPIEGYYQVSVGSEVLYVDSDAEHFFLGQLFNIESDALVNVTEAQRSERRLEMLAEVDDDSIIRFAPEGEVKGRLRIFTDVTCGFCRQLHEQIAEMNEAGIQVDYLAYPRSGIERDGVLTHEYTETVKAWCAEDRQDVLTRLKAGERVEGEVCENNPVADHYALGRQFGVTGTPAIILPDGTLAPGYRPTEEFVRLLGIED